MRLRVEKVEVTLWGDHQNVKKEFIETENRVTRGCRERLMGRYCLMATEFNLG